MPRIGDDTGGMRRVTDDTGGMRRVADDTGSTRRVAEDIESPSKPRSRAGSGLGSFSAASGAFPARRTTGVDSHTGPETTAEDLPTVRKPGSTPAVAFSPGSPAGAYPTSGGPAGAGVPWPDPFDTGRTAAGGPLPGPSTPLWPDVDGPSGSFETGSSWSAPGGPPPRDPMAFGAAPPPGPRPQPRQSRVVTAGMVLLGVVALAVVAFTGVVYYTGEDNQIRDVLGGGGDQQVVSGPINDMNIATFELMAATDRVRLRVDDLGADLYRVSSPEGSGVRPRAEVRDDRLRVDLNRDTAGSGGEVEVVLSAKVRWTIRFSGYSAERIVDLTEGRIKAIELVGGTRRAEMNLAQANGTVPMKITGGVEELILRAPTGSPVRIKVGGGAATVTAGSKTLKDVAPGSTLTPKDWTSGNRYDVDAVAPVTLLKVETSAPS